jgi:hypothetical protein
VNIYVDESGAFLVPTRRPHLVCCVAGLVIPTGRESELFFEFLRLRDQWPLNRIEVKGSRLDEAQIEAVIDLLASHGALLQIVATDMALYDEARLDAFRQDQASRILRHVTPEHQPSLVAQLSELRDRWLAASNQLFVQSVLTIHLLEELFQTATLFYVLRTPAELGCFKWTIDAKDRALTDVEHVWKTLLMPMLQTQSLKKPLLLPKGSDFSHFKEFQVDESTPDEKMQQAIRWLKTLDPPPAASPRYSGVSLNHVFRDLEFSSSMDSLGLQLADIVASACTRAFNGTLQEQGWARLGSLLVKRKGGSIHFAELSKDPEAIGTQRPLDEALASVLRRVEQGTRSVWP